MQILKYVIDDKSGRLLEKNSKDEPKADVWPVPLTKTKGRIKNSNKQYLFININANTVITFNQKMCSVL